MEDPASNLQRNLAKLLERFQKLLEEIKGNSDDNNKNDAAALARKQLCLLYMATVEDQKDRLSELIEEKNKSGQSFTANESIKYFHQVREELNNIQVAEVVAIDENTQTEDKPTLQGPSETGLTIYLLDSDSHDTK
ncbi:hypothetical protein CKAH01_15070 [Colletotrichum kahawae]|uniref:Uncharacterized protein n=1 Tax=Colletotrichum kahawae TaxID=34407 RepID=A0AAD9YMS3_COLKA|nr:hypothetical protein CKAH01_15070 [Colletotrichum kahawae]